MLLWTRNSSPPCSNNGEALSWIFLTSSSTSDIFLPTSATIFFAVYLPSCSEKTFLALRSSDDTSTIWSDIFLAPSLWASEFLVSRVRAELEVRAASTSAWASFSNADSFSQSANASSSVIGSSVSWVSGSTASANFFTWASAEEIFSPVSCICAVFLRPSVSLRNEASFAAAALILSVSLPNSSAAGFEASSEKCLSSKFFEPMKVRAWLMAACAAEAASSDALMVSAASVSGNTSMPFKKGSSASLTFSSALSTSSTFLAASLREFSHCTFSR
mmetsp:Transcript_112055/g.327733  ORF Transcript_112055/g.327733 Transcript_112055/m.327733 type:complete len:275 (-) Transcript_112055:2847-3671(-)